MDVIGYKWVEMDLIGCITKKMDVIGYKWVEMDLIGCIFSNGASVAT